MKNKPSGGTRLLVSSLGSYKAARNRRTVSQEDLFLYAESFSKAARTLAAAFQLDFSPFAEADASPVVFMYRQAVELHLKAMVLGEGGNFLPSKPDTLSVHKTHSISWLAQFVSQIITTLNWENEFTCYGVETLAEFKAVINDLNATDPGSYVFRLPASAVGNASALGRDHLTIQEFARRMDALLDLLASTTDALAATWDMQSEETGIEAAGNSRGFEPPVQ